MAALTVEPSVSETRLLLERGGVVLSLKTRAESPFVIYTPVGAIHASAGVFLVRIDKEQGGVLKFRVAGVSAPLSFQDGKNAPVQIHPGKEITVRITTQIGGNVRPSRER